MTKKFEQQNEEVRKQWREMNLITLNAHQLETMHEDLRAFKHLDSKRQLYRYLVHKGAGSWVAEDSIAVRPDQYEAEMHKIDQWGRWRSEKFPFDAKKAFDEYRAAKQDIHMRTLDGTII
jgi:hypothetical protein